MRSRAKWSGTPPNSLAFCRVLNPTTTTRRADRRTCGARWRGDGRSGRGAGRGGRGRARPGGPGGRGAGRAGRAGPARPTGGAAGLEAPRASADAPPGQGAPPGAAGAAGPRQVQLQIDAEDAYSAQLQRERAEEIERLAAQVSTVNMIYRDIRLARRRAAGGRRRDRGPGRVALARPDDVPSPPREPSGAACRSTALRLFLVLPAPPHRAHCVSPSSSRDSPRRLPARCPLRLVESFTILASFFIVMSAGLTPPG